ncbi:MAG: hypothetical protein WA867_16260, partial [Candidatus Acidiferrales bacterium]
MQLEIFAESECARFTPWAQQAAPYGPCRINLRSTDAFIGCRNTGGALKCAATSSNSIFFGDAAEWLVWAHSLLQE